MKIVTFNCSRYKTLQEAVAEIFRSLGHDVPEAGNLTQLKEALLQIRDKTVLVLDEQESLRRNLRRDAAAFLNTLDAAKEENPYLDIVAIEDTFE